MRVVFENFFVMHVSLYKNHYFVTVFLFFSECFCRAEKPWSYLLRKYSSTGYLQAFIHVYDLKFHDIDDDDDS